MDTPGGQVLLWIIKFKKSSTDGILVLFVQLSVIIPQEPPKKTHLLGDLSLVIMITKLVTHYQ